MAHGSMLTTNVVHFTECTVLNNMFMLHLIAAMPLATPFPKDSNPKRMEKFDKCRKTYNLSKFKLSLLVVFFKS